MRGIKRKTGRKEETRAKRRLWVKVISIIVLCLLAIPIIILLYLVLSPDYMVLIVKSESMKPTFEMGDVIVLRTYEDGEIEPGQIIAFNVQGNTVTHRAVAVDEGVITTRGDAVEDADPWELNSTNVRGTYVLKVPYLGYIAKFFRSKAGAMLLIIAASLFLIGLVVSEMFSSRGAGKGGDEEEEKPEVHELRKQERERKQT